MLRSVPVICIAGPSASGKTTLAGALEQHLACEGRFALRISCDDYYRQDWIPHAIFGYDTVDAIDTVDATASVLDTVDATSPLTPLTPHPP